MIDGMKRQFDDSVTTGCVGGVMQSSKIREVVRGRYENLKIFYGYHVAIGNAMRLMKKRDEAIRDSLVSQLDAIIPQLSRTEKDLLFIK